MIHYLSKRRFNAIDSLGMILIALAWHDQNWLAVLVIATVFPLASVLAERKGGES